MYKIKTLFYFRAKTFKTLVIVFYCHGDSVLYSQYQPNTMLINH